jgi:hypothetical protein
MGFFGLNHWGSSDNAADFASQIQDIDCSWRQTKVRDRIRKFVAKEFKEQGNEYNTPGVLNIALVLDAEGTGDNISATRIPIFSKYLDLRTLKKLHKDLIAESKRWSKEFKPDIIRLAKSVNDKIKARQRRN